MPLRLRKHHLNAPISFNSFMQFTLHTLMVADPQYKGLAVAWIITSSCTEATLTPVLEAFVKRVQMNDPWPPRMTVRGQWPPCCLAEEATWVEEECQGPVAGAAENKDSQIVAEQSHWQVDQL